MIELLESRRLLSGQTITVDVLNDMTTVGHTTLRDAIAIANADGGDTIQFAAGLNGTITLQQGVFSITNSMTITGPGANLVTISGNNQSSIFDVGSSSNSQFAVTISGLAMTAANTSGLGGAILNAKSLTLSNDVVTGNHAGSGGAVFSMLGSTLTSNNNTYSNNTAGVSGGAISSLNALVSTDDMFSGNSITSYGSAGGAVFAAGQLTITHGTFTGNIANGWGGGLFAYMKVPATLSDNVFSNNTGTIGGGLYMTSSDLSSPMALTSTNDQFIGNTSTTDPSAGGGGGIYVKGNLVLINDVVSGNEAQRGGGIYNIGNLTVTGTTIANNTAGAGGGVFNSAIMTTLSNTFVGNSAIQAGGGVLNAGEVRTSVWTSTNDTYVSNTAGGGGGGILNGASLKTVNDTITGNQAYLGSGIYGEGEWYSLNTIVVGNLGDDYFSAPLSGSANNLLNLPAGKTLADVLQTVPGSNPLQPLLANNGGPTQTVALAPGSLASGVGSAITQLSQSVTDQSTFFPLNTNYHFAGGQVSFRVGDLLRIDNEIVLVTAYQNFGVTVVRGQNGTTAAAHAANALLNLAFDATGALRVNNDLGAVAAINHAPQGTSATLTAAIGLPYTLKLSDFGMTDPFDHPANSLMAVKFTLLSSAGTLTDFGQPVATGQFVSAADISAGGLVFTPSFSQTGTYFLAKFQVQDNGGTVNGGVDLDPSAKILYVQYVVNAVPNHPPVGTTSTVTSSLSTPYPLKASDFGFTDPNDTVANSLMAVQITLLPGLGTLTLDGAPVTVNQFISVADINAGKLVFTPTVTQTGTFFLCKFRVQDNGGTANGGLDLDQTARVLYINLVTLNHAPVGTTSTVTAALGSPYTVKATDFGFTDPNDTPPNSLAAVKISLLPSLGTLSLSGVAVTAGQLISVTDINAGRLVFTPTVSQSGTYFLCKFQVQDNGNSAYGSTNRDPTAKVLYIQLVISNHSPVGTSNTLTTMVNTPYVLKTSDFGFTDPNDTPPNALLAVQFTLLPTLGVLALDGTTVTANQFISAADISVGKLVFTPTVSQPGTYFLSKFRVQDNGGTANGGVDLDQVDRILYFKLTAQIGGTGSGVNAS